MTINNPGLATVLIFIMALLLVLQAVGIALAMAKMDRKLSELHSNFDRIVRHAARNLQEVHRVLRQFRWMRDEIPNVAKKVNGFLDSTAPLIEQTDKKSGKALVTATEKVDEAGRRFEIALGQFSRQTTQLTRKLHYPTAHVSAVVKGVLAGFQALKGKKRPTPLQDEEIFI